MTTRADIVREARSWIGTRWRHAQAQKGVGTDCIGLVAEVGARCGLLPQDWRNAPGAAQFMGYGRSPHNGSLERAMAMFFPAIGEAEAGPGDVVVMIFADQPHHVAILGDHVHGGLSVIHAFAQARKVVETRLDDKLRQRIVSFHRYPGVQAWPV